MVQEFITHVLHGDFPVMNSFCNSSLVILTVNNPRIGHIYQISPYNISMAVKLQSAVRVLFNYKQNLLINLTVNAICPHDQLSNKNAHIHVFLHFVLLLNVNTFSATCKYITILKTRVCTRIASNKFKERCFCKQQRFCFYGQGFHFLSLNVRIRIYKGVFDHNVLDYNIYYSWRNSCLYVYDNHVCLMLLASLQYFCPARLPNVLTNCDSFRSSFNCLTFLKSWPNQATCTKALDLINNYFNRSQNTHHLTFDI